jgi:hypothetical protein
MCDLSLSYTGSFHLIFYVSNHEAIKIAESVVLILYVRRDKDIKNNCYRLLKLSDFWIKSSNSIPDYYLKNGFTEEKVLFFSLITEDTSTSLLPLSPPFPLNRENEIGEKT